jgi:transcription termination factor Rho
MIGTRRPLLPLPSKNLGGSASAIRRSKNGWIASSRAGRAGEPRTINRPLPPPRPAHPPQPAPPVQAQHFGDLPNPARFHDLAALDALAAEIGAGQASPLYLDHLYALNLAELTAQARQLGVALEGVPNRKQVMEGVLRLAAERKTPIFDRGWLDLSDRGHGFVVHERFNYRLYPENCYVPESLIRRFGLKRGHQLEVVAQGPQPGERCPAALAIKSVMARDPVEAANVPPFEELIPYYPLKRILLEAPDIHKDISMRAIDLLTPVGFGQRGLIVAPPRTGKTVLLQNIANSVSNNYPEARLIILLVDERPEEVTDFRRHTKGEVVSSTFDEAPESHMHAAEMVIEKARRLVELGEHVVILLDSITRLARAYNALAANSGKIMSGGLEATALQRPKRFFGSARNIEGAGSLTILGTALIDTGSRMDEIIFEEFKGTGNMELHLDRGLSDKRVFPAINIDRSGTRKEELIYHPEEMLRVYGLRRAMQGIPPVEAMDMLIQRLKKTKTNAEFLLGLNR